MNDEMIEQLVALVTNCHCVYWRQGFEFIKLVRYQAEFNDCPSDPHSIAEPVMWLENGNHIALMSVNPSDLYWGEVTQLDFEALGDVSQQHTGADFLLTLLSRIVHQNSKELAAQRSDVTLDMNKAKLTPISGEEQGDFAVLIPAKAIIDGEPMQGEMKAMYAVSGALIDNNCGDWAPVS